MTLTDEELTKFGIVPGDEWPHAFDPAHEWWNESWFWDWIDQSGTRAGHVRAGWHPNQQRFWLWFFLWNGEEWAAVEEPRLPMTAFPEGTLAYDGWGLTFSWEAAEPLRAGRLRCSGFGRVLSGPRAGFVLPISVDLSVRALGAPHSPGRHADGGYDAGRFEQPVRVSGTGSFAGAELAFDGYGERDHSWGPRDWNMQWLFVVLHGDDLRLQWARAEVPNVGTFVAGYVHRDVSLRVTDVADDIVFDHDNVTHPVSGHFTATAEDGSTVAGTLEPLTGTEIDITHAVVPHRPTIYRRALVRFTPDGGGRPTLGWVEFNRFER